MEVDKGADHRISTLLPETSQRMGTVLSHAVAAAALAGPPAKYDSCKGSTGNPHLRFNISAFPDPFGTNQSLASAVCCDERQEAYAEPQGLYATVGLFAELDRSGHGRDGVRDGGLRLGR